MGKGSEKDAGQRVFVAADLPREARDELAAWLRTAAVGPGTKPVPPQKMHLTLCFLGERDGFEVQEAQRALAEVAHPVGRLMTSAPIWLPRKRPRVLAVEVKESGQRLRELQAALSAELERSIDWKEPRGFRPHVTLARFSRGARPHGGPLPPTPAIAFTPATITLYRSILSSEGAEYEPLASASLM